MPLSNAEAEQVYDLLVAHAGADEGQRAYFVRHHIDPEKYRFLPTEFRFQGDFGFGGKFKYGVDMWYVTAYSEDHPRVAAKLEFVNDKLKAMRKELRG